MVHWYPKMGVVKESGRGQLKIFPRTSAWISTHTSAPPPENIFLCPCNGALSKVVKWSPLSLRYIVHLHTECHVWVSVSDVQGEGRLPSQGDGEAVNGEIHIFDFI